MNPNRKQNWAALLGIVVMSLALLHGAEALAGEPASPAAAGLATSKPKPKAGLLLPAVQAAREAASAGRKGQSNTKKPDGKKKPKDIAWPVPICKPGPGCPP